MNAKAIRAVMVVYARILTALFNAIVNLVFRNCFIYLINSLRASVISKTQVKYENRYKSVAKPLYTLQMLPPSKLMLPRNQCFDVDECLIFNGTEAFPGLNCNDQAR